MLKINEVKSILQLVWATSRTKIQVTGCSRHVQQTLKDSTIKELTVATSELTLVIEAIDSVDGSTLVVTTQQKEVLRVFYFVRQQ